MTLRMTASEARAELAKTRKRTDREGPIHKGILEVIPLIMPGAVVHHSPNEVDMAGSEAAKVIAKARKLGTRKGWPDLEWIWRSRFMTFEVKAPGNYPSEDQKACGAAIIKAGGFWAVVRSVDQATALLGHWKDQVL